MKKLILGIVLVLMFPCGVLAQEKTLFELSTETIGITEMVMQYMVDETQNTEKNLLLLKSDAKHMLQDLLRLMRSRDAHKMSITVEQAVELKAKALDILKNVNKLQGNNCNDLAYDYFVGAYLIFLLGLVLTLSIGGAIYGIPLIMISLFVVLLGVIAFILCSLAP